MRCLPSRPCGDGAAPVSVADGLHGFAGLECGEALAHTPEQLKHARAYGFGSGHGRRAPVHSVRAAGLADIDARPAGRRLRPDRLLRGEILGSFALSEPAVGSDPGGEETRDDEDA